MDRARMSTPATPMQRFDQANDEWAEHKASCSLCRNGIACAKGIPIRAEVLRLARLAAAWADD